MSGEARRFNGFYPRNLGVNKMPDLIAASLDIGETRDDFMRSMGVNERVDNSADNNGGSTDYYKISENWVDLIDIIENKRMNYNQGNILKAAFCFNSGRHQATTYERELNKIIYFASRELERMKRQGLQNDSKKVL